MCYMARYTAKISAPLYSPHTTIYHHISTQAPAVCTHHHKLRDSQCPQEFTSTYIKSISTLLFQLNSSLESHCNQTRTLQRPFCWSSMPKPPTTKMVVNHDCKVNTVKDCITCMKCYNTTILTYKLVL